MEALIQIHEGNIPKNGTCFYCDNKARYIIGMIDTENMVKTEVDNYVFTSVGLCVNHAEAFNSLLSGEHDIDKLLIHRTNFKKNKLNLRR